MLVRVLKLGDPTAPPPRSGEVTARVAAAVRAFEGAIRSSAGSPRHPEGPDRGEVVTQRRGYCPGVSGCRACPAKVGGGEARSSLQSNPGRDFPHVVEQLAPAGWFILGGGNGLRVSVTGRPPGAQEGEDMKATVQ